MWHSQPTPTEPNCNRCSKCDINWHPSPAYKVCPICGATCWKTHMQDVLTGPESVEQARNARETRESNEKRRRDYKAKEARFDKYYADREARLLKRDLDEGLPC